MRVSFDNATAEWFMKNPNAETTVMYCEKCRKYYKPSLGHKCENVCGMCFYWDENDTCTVGSRCNHPQKRWRHQTSAYRYWHVKACKMFDPKDEEVE